MAPAGCQRARKVLGISMLHGIVALEGCTGGGSHDIYLLEPAYIHRYLMSDEKTQVVGEEKYLGHARPPARFFRKAVKTLESPPEHIQRRQRFQHRRPT
jgi:hypothetical protein